MKAAVIFSGYPRFVEECHKNISENLLSQLTDYDIFARFQWSDKTLGQKIHHEFDSVFQKDETKSFQELYADKIKRLEVIEPMTFDTSWYNSTYSQLPWLNLEESREVVSRLKCQYKCLEDAVSMIENTQEYTHIIRIRTDIIFSQKVNVEELLEDRIVVQDGYVAGFDRRFSDWFLCCPVRYSGFFSDLANLEEHYKHGLVHMHNLMEKLSTRWPMIDKQFYADTPSTTKTYNFFK